MRVKKNETSLLTAKILESGPCMAYFQMSLLHDSSVHPQKQKKTKKVLSTLDFLRGDKMTTMALLLLIKIAHRSSKQTDNLKIVDR